MFSLQSIVYLVIAVILSMSIHETAHGLVSYWMGDPTAKLEGRLSLNPFKHVDWLGLVCLLICGFGWANRFQLMQDIIKTQKQGLFGLVLRGLSQIFF